jgi:hypothetical protein
MKKNIFDIFIGLLTFLFTFKFITKLILLITDKINIEYDNNDRLELIYKNNKWMGKLKDNTKIYKGEYTLDCKKNGYFIVVYNNGNIWSGYFKNNLEQGDFICKFRNENIVTGNFINGKREGNWITNKPNGDVFYYSYNNNIKNPFVVIKYANGNIFEGIYKNNSKNGIGIIRYPSSTVFIGNYENGIKSGKGFIQFKNEQFLECNYENNLLNGQCILYYVSGEKLIIDYNDGKFNNPTTFLYNNGNKYVGGFNHDFKKEGFGIYYDKISNKSFLQYYDKQKTKDDDIKSIFWFHGDHTEIVSNQEFTIKNKLLEQEKEKIYCYVKMDYVFKPVILNCGHKFCYYFLKSWKKHCPVLFHCPLCRQEISEIKNNDKAEKILSKCKFEINNKKISIQNIQKYFDFISMYT